MTRFYVLEPADRILFGTRWAYAEPVGSCEFGDVPQHCPVCGTPIGSLEWLPPHRIKLSSAKPEKWGDFLWGAGFLLMVSHRFKKAYEAEGLTGIEKFYPPAEIRRVGRRKTGDLPPDLPTYYLVQIRWGAANLDDQASGVERYPSKSNCAYCRDGIRRLERVVIEPDSWDGSDIFIPRGLEGTILVSERFKQVVEAYGLRNALFIPAERYAYDERRPGLWYVREE